MIRLYTSLVRPHLEYGNPVWSPRFIKDKAIIENVQRRATRMIPEVQGLPYTERLKHLNLPTLAYRRIRGDMIEAYKILNKCYDKKVSKLLCLHRDTVDNPDWIRGHSKKLYKNTWKLKIRENFFSNRITNAWNSLPEKVVSAPSIYSFERHLDKFWSSQDFKKAIKIYHTNNTPVQEEAGSDEDIYEDLPIQFDWSTAGSTT